MTWIIISWLVLDGLTLVTPQSCLCLTYIDMLSLCFLGKFWMIFSFVCVFSLANLFDGTIRLRLFCETERFGYSQRAIADKTMRL